MFGKRHSGTVGKEPPPAQKTRGAEEVKIPSPLALLPVRGTVLFPRTVVPLLINSAVAIKTVEELAGDSEGAVIAGVIAQRSQEPEEPVAADLYAMGCAARILKVLRQPEGGALLLVQGLSRFTVARFVHTSPYLRAEIKVLEEEPGPGAVAGSALGRIFGRPAGAEVGNGEGPRPREVASERQWEAEVKNLRESALRLLGLTPEVPEQARSTIGGLSDGGHLADLLATNLPLDVAQKQALLEELEPVARVRAVQIHVTTQLEIAQIQQKLQHEVQSQFGDAQRRAYLHEQLRAIQRELGEAESGVDTQGEQLRVRLEAAGLSAEVNALAERELKRLQFIPPASPEYSVIVSYLEALSDLPWQTLTEDNLDLEEARRILERDHFDLEKVKRRLLEYLAVRKLNPQGRGPILCFVGPPGVGKTSLGQSIADALGRKFARMSLGGIRDEAEIRGHRRTYIGSMPGRIIQELRRVGSRNPVIMLDEVDKIGADFRGDPASALLEVLDPWQNSTFVDRYLDVPFDLSRVLFIATANYLDPVPAPLRDRMEVIELPGYTEREKLEIARRYLTGRELEENGLHAGQCVWQDASLSRVISDYTHEAGVRELDRQIAAVCRAVAARIARNEAARVEITPEEVTAILGPAKYVSEKRLSAGVPGVATGLAYTPMGGEVLHIEATRYPGKGEITLTGQLGGVMRESVEAALSLLRSRAASLGINSQAFKVNDIHVHVPSGAVPKDGPSAGVAMFTALASLFTNTPVRPDVAMTGEITLRGLILPVGGIKEKSLAAMRAGIGCVLIPKLNEKDLSDLPAEVKERLVFQPVETIDAVMELAFENRPSPGTAGAYSAAAL